MRSAKTAWLLRPSSWHGIVSHTDTVEVVDRGKSILTSIINNYHTFDLESINRKRSGKYKESKNIPHQGRQSIKEILKLNKTGNSPRHIIGKTHQCSCIVGVGKMGTAIFWPAVPVRPHEGTSMVEHDCHRVNTGDSQSPSSKPVYGSLFVVSSDPMVGMGQTNETKRSSDMVAWLMKLKDGKDAPRLRAPSVSKQEQLHLPSLFLMNIPSDFTKYFEFRQQPRIPAYSSPQTCRACICLVKKPLRKHQYLFVYGLS